MSSEYKNLIQRVEDIETNNKQLSKYTGSLNDLNINGNFAGGPCTDYPAQAGNGWGYIINLKTSDTEIFQTYADKAKNDIFFRFKKSGAWGEWKKIEDTIEIGNGQEFATLFTKNGKRIYGKEIDCGNLPNAGVKSIPTGLSSLSAIKLVEARGITSSGYPLPFIAIPNSATYSIQMYCYGSGIEIKTATDYSNQTATVTIYYTKNNE